MSSLAIQQMSWEEKLRAMEELWESLSADATKLESPEWHGDALRDTEQRNAMRRGRNSQSIGPRRSGSCANTANEVADTPFGHPGPSSRPGVLRPPKRHPSFIDGNKRTGFVIGVLFPELNGYRFKGREEAAARAVLELAAGTIDESAFWDFLRASSKRIRK